MTPSPHPTLAGLLRSLLAMVFVAVWSIPTTAQTLVPTPADAKLLQQAVATIVKQKKAKAALTFVDDRVVNVNDPGDLPCCFDEYDRLLEAYAESHAARYDRFDKTFMQQVRRKFCGHDFVAHTYNDLFHRPTIYSVQLTPVVSLHTPQFGDVRAVAAFFNTYDDQLPSGESVLLLFSTKGKLLLTVEGDGYTLSVDEDMPDEADDTDDAQQ